MNTEVEHEIALRHRWVRDARRRNSVARIRLALLRLPELCGSRWAHQAADDQRDIIGHGRYAIEEFLQVADKMRRRGRVETWDALVFLDDPSDNYDGWLAPEDQYCGQSRL